MEIVEELLAYLGVHLWFFVWYPVVLWDLTVGDPWTMLAWFAIGALLTYAAHRFWRGVLLKPFIAVWFMPASIICGAASVWPLPFAVRLIFAPGRCATPASAALSFLLNCALLYGCVALVKKWRKRSLRASKA